MLGLDSISTAIKAGAILLAAATVAGIVWYVSHLRDEVSELTQANQTLQASVSVANAAAADSAKAAQDIAIRAKQAQQIVAETHAATDAINTTINSITQEVALAPISEKSCLPDGGLPLVLVRAADRLFDAPTGGGGADGDGKDQGSTGAAVVPGMADGK